jgi:hypothetical protein
MKYQIFIRKSDKSVFILSFVDLLLAQKVFEAMLPTIEDFGSIELQQFETIDLFIPDKER